jgi:hypothetical protein
MKRFTTLTAAVLGALTSAAVAQPRGRAQADAAAASSADDEDGPEAKGVALFKLDDIIEVAVRLSPDIARARTDRDIARGSAGAAGRDQAWVLSAGANFERDALGADTPENRLAPLQVVAEDKVTASLGLGRNLPTGGNVALELGLSHNRQSSTSPARSSLRPSSSRASAARTSTSSARTRPA